MLYYRAEWPAGGQDSWNHYLYAHWGIKHPHILLDQWAKPLFTIPAVPFAQFGIEGVYFFNVVCCLGTAWFCYLIARKLGMRLPWMAAAFFLFQPIVFGNVISSLTEPINALVLSYILYLFASQKVYLAAVWASFLPFFRSEGFVILCAIILYLLVCKKWKAIPLVFLGSALFTLLAGIISGNWAWVINQNPYIKFETDNKFDPGHGSFMHYLNSHKTITGFVISILIACAFIILALHVIYLLRKKTPEEKSRFAFWLWAPIFVTYFLAHTIIWWAGIMGSQGLTRVFVVVAPCAALLALYAFDRFVQLELGLLNKTLPIIILLGCIYTAYKANNWPYPFQNSPTEKAYPGEQNIYAALKFIQSKNLDKKLLIHQLPSLNAQRNLDPWDEPETGKTFYLWSLDTRPGKDWFPDSTIVLWDNWHARRDAPMPLDSLKKLKEYHQIAYFPNADSNYTVRVFLKVKQ
jgi:hypothetical protein